MSGKLVAALYLVAWLNLSSLSLSFLTTSRPIAPTRKNNDRRPSPAYPTARLDLSSSGDATTSATDRWAKHGLLISSFSDGLFSNVEARKVLQQGLIRTLMVELVRQLEVKIRDSVRSSPCCGPTDIDAWTQLDRLDTTLRRLENGGDPISLWHSIQSSTKCNSGNKTQVEIPDNTALRVVYIPTALYALRVDSQSSPGKQRQRARADGKKRRDRLYQLLQILLSSHGGKVDIPIQICTLDLGDGSVKQPYSSNEELPEIPLNGKQILGTWCPHLVYVEGGNTFWLYHCMKKGGWENDLISVCTSDQAYYIGASAGAIIAGRLVETACWKGWDDPRVVPGMGDPEDWRSVKGLDLVGGASFFPHHDDQYSALVHRRSEEFKGRETVVTIRDNEACYLCGGRQEMMVLQETPSEKIFSSVE